MRLTIQKKSIVIVIIFFLVAFAIVGAIIVPSIMSIRELDEQTINLRTYLEKKYQKTHNIRMSVQESEQMRSSTKTFPDHLFHGSQTLELVTTLESFAASNSVDQRIGATTLDQVTEGKATLAITVTGDYKNVLAYMRDIENLKYFMTITSLQMSPLADRNSQTSASTPVSLSLQLSIYVSP